VTVHYDIQKCIGPVKTPGGSRVGSRTLGRQGPDHEGCGDPGGEDLGPYETTALREGIEVPLPDRGEASLYEVRVAP